MVIKLGVIGKAPNYGGHYEGSLNSSSAHNIRDVPSLSFFGLGLDGAASPTAAAIIMKTYSGQSGRPADGLHPISNSRARAEKSARRIMRRWSGFRERFIIIIPTSSPA